MRLWDGLVEFMLAALDHTLQVLEHLKVVLPRNGWADHLLHYSFFFAIVYHGRVDEWGVQSLRAEACEREWRVEARRQDLRYKEGW